MTAPIDKWLEGQPASVREEVAIDILADAPPVSEECFAEVADAVQPEFVSPERRIAEIMSDLAIEIGRLRTENRSLKAQVADLKRSDA